MLGLRNTVSVGIAALLALGCSSPSTVRGIPVQQLFLHVTHRETYRLTDAELRDIRFYVSTTVLVQRPAGDTEMPGTQGELRVRRVDPGVVKAIGPNWLRVSFTDGEGTLFVTEGTDEHQHYRFATELADREGMFLVKDLTEPAVYYKGTMYPVVLGADSKLLVDVYDLRGVLATRDIQDD